MNKFYLMALNDESIFTIKCTFPSSDRVYTFICRLEEKPKVGQYAVVETNSSRTLTVAKIVEVDDFADIDEHATFDYRWCVHYLPVFIDDYRERLKLEEETSIADLEKNFRKLKQEKQREQIFKYKKALNPSADDASANDKPSVDII